MWEVELAVIETQEQFGAIPKGTARQLRKKVKHIDAARISEIEQRTQHDLVAFVEYIGERAPSQSRYFHRGMTSSDVIDTVTGIQMKQSLELIITALKETEKTLAMQARRYKDTAMIGRTHGMHAQPITFGLKLAVWYAELERHQERLKQALPRIVKGKLSGAVGTYAQIEPRVEKSVMKKLGLTSDEASTQIIQRDRHAEYLSLFALLAASLEKFALEIRNLQRTEIGEVQEPFGAGQKGSSAMPHKKNPVKCEQLCGLARLVRSNARAALENVALYHERDISHSSVERIILPDSSILIHYMLKRANYIISGLKVHSSRMLENLKKSGGQFFSQALLVALTDSGMSWEKAYALVQKSAIESARTDKKFLDRVLENKTIVNQLSEKCVRKCFDLRTQLKYVPAVLRRLGIIK
jgi:adenylosuccinate lyase